MRYSAAILAVMLVITGCTGDDTTPGTSDSPDSGDTTVPPPLAMGLVVRLKAGVGSGHLTGIEVEEILIQNAIDPFAGDPSRSERGRPLTDTERSEIDRLAADVGPVRWIEDAAAERSQDPPTTRLVPVVTIGEVTFDESGALVSLSVWCGRGCGVWGTYRVQSVGPAQWVVTGVVAEILP